MARMWIRQGRIISLVPLQPRAGLDPEGPHQLFLAHVDVPTGTVVAAAVGESSVI